MTPYVRFQERLIPWLEELQEKRYDLLVILASACEAADADGMNWQQLLRGLGFSFEEEPWHHEVNFRRMILDQIERREDGKVGIRGWLGMSLVRRQVCNTLEKWAQFSSISCVRTDKYAHVEALVPGDVLINGDKILSPPREGGNGSVLLHVPQGTRGVWLSYPARTILALAGCHEGPLPPELLK